MAKQIKTCKYCGADGFFWTQTSQGWRLTDPSTGSLHLCAVTKVSLTQKAIDMGLSPDMANSMRLRDLQQWIEDNASEQTPQVPEEVTFTPPAEAPADDKPTTIAGSVNGKVELPEGWTHVHPNFHKSVRYFNAVPRANQWWAGPAGSGKTTLADAVAQALGKRLVVVSISKNTAEFDLKGYMDGHGRFVKGSIYDAFTGGNVLLLIDECDRGTDGVLVALNSALDQRVITFPNGERVELDAGTVVVATGNTWGRGADAVYTAAGALDAAFLDRFQFKLAHEYDEAFELSITSNTKWTRYVQRVRKAVFDLRIQGIVISPRCSRDGGEAINAGIPWAEVEQDTLWASIPVELQASVRQKMGIAA